MDYSKLFSYQFFDFQLSSPSLLCRFQACAISRHDDIIRFYTGEAYLPVCMLLLNISTTSMTIEYAGEKIDIIHFTKAGGDECTLYAHK